MEDRDNLEDDIHVYGIFLYNKMYGNVIFDINYPPLTDIIFTYSRLYIMDDEGD